MDPMPFHAKREQQEASVPLHQLGVRLSCAKLDLACHMLFRSGDVDDLRERLLSTLQTMASFTITINHQHLTKSGSTQGSVP